MIDVVHLFEVALCTAVLVSSDASDPIMRDLPLLRASSYSQPAAFSVFLPLGVSVSHAGKQVWTIPAPDT